MTEARARVARKGTGHIFQRPDGTWYAQWSSRDPATGARRQHKKGAFRTERDARRFMTEQIGKIYAGTFVAPPKPKLVREVLEAWIATKTNEVRPTTIEGYQVAVHRWLIPRLGGTMMPALTEQDVRDAIADLAEHGGKNGGPLSARSCQLALVTLRMAVSWAIRQGWAVRNVAADVKVRPTRQPVHPWTKEQARSFVAAIQGDRLVALYTLAITRGPRRGELCGLRWDNVDLDAGAMTITATQVMVGGRPVESEPKTAAGRRRIGLDPSLVDVLRAHRRRQMEDRLAAGPAWMDSGYVFTDEIGQPVRPDHVTVRFRRLCRQVGVPAARFHDLRHTAASLMLGAKISTKVVAEILGHADTRITQDIYQHLMPGMADEAGAVLSQMVL